MDLNIENISRLDNNSSYYLSDNGEIKKSGLLHKFKCFFGLGHSRQRVSNLINAIRNTILEASGGAAQGKRYHKEKAEGYSGCLYGKLRISRSVDAFTAGRDFRQQDKEDR